MLHILSAVVCCLYVLIALAQVQCTFFFTLLTHPTSHLHLQAVYVFFKEREPVDLPTILTLLVAVPSASITLKNYLNLVNPVFGTSCLQSFFVFYLVLLSCMMAYRLSSFHPLYKYPGPFLCKVTKLWITWLAYRGKLHLYYKSLHDMYGPIVRIGE
jgi:hypothetical protein